LRHNRELCERMIRCRDLCRNAGPQAKTIALSEENLVDQVVSGSWPVGGLCVEPFHLSCRNHERMKQLYSWPWMETQVARTIEVWNSSVAPSMLVGMRYSLKEQQTREKAYDEALRAVEREAKRTPRNRPGRFATKNRVTASFARLAAAALDLEDEMIALVINDFLPVGTRLARWARRFDPSLSHGRHDSGMPECLDRVRASTPARRAREHHAIHSGIQSPVSI
jgi:hypothetical protein